MYIISGCPRSGTSLMMDIMRETFGEERIRGHKFPQEQRIKDNMEQKEDESTSLFECKKYMYEKQNPDWEAELVASKDMNPNGFWEGRYSVQGISYNFQDKEELKEMVNEKEKTIYKIVSQGLWRSDPQFIDKIVFMIRHPRAVAKSQEKLKRNLKFKTPDGRDIDFGKDIVIHTPEMFNRVTVMACRFLLANPEIPVHFVNFDDLVSNPVDTLQGVQDFLGEGNFDAAASRIDPKLKRSYPEEIENNLWEDAEYIYNKFNEKEFQDIVDYMSEDVRATNRQNRNWLCTRTGLVTVEGHCKSCKSDPNFRQSLKDHANQQNVDWTVEPCLYECGFNADEEPITIEQSIENNFWLT